MRPRQLIVRMMSLLVAFAAVFLGLQSVAHASTNIRSATDSHWAWNDTIGWMDFYNTATVTLTSQKLTGYASSSIGDISFDCATTRSGNICGQSNYSVTNDGAGNLSGWGWSDAYGWISFYCGNTGGCGTSNYRVLIDGATGDFSNYAWNDIVGWVSFNCADPVLCGTSSYKVSTSWQATSTSASLDSTTFDTNVTLTIGARLNSVLWQGLQPAGTSVKFQFAVATSSAGPWNYAGSDGTSATYYTVDPNTSKTLDYVFHAGRYFRYRVFLTSNVAQTDSPRIDTIIVNWSP